MVLVWCPAWLGALCSLEAVASLWNLWVALSGTCLSGPWWGWLILPQWAEKKQVLEADFVMATTAQLLIVVTCLVAVPFLVGLIS